MIPRFLSIVDVVPNGITANVPQHPRLVVEECQCISAKHDPLFHFRNLGASSNLLINTEHKFTVCLLC